VPVERQAHTRPQVLALVLAILAAAPSADGGVCPQLELLQNPERELKLTAAPAGGWEVESKDVFIGRYPPPSLRAHLNADCTYVAIERWGWPNRTGDSRVNVYASAELRSEDLKTVLRWTHSAALDPTSPAQVTARARKDVEPRVPEEGQAGALPPAETGTPSKQQAVFLPRPCQAEAPGLRVCAVIHTGGPVTRLPERHGRWELYGVSGMLLAHDPSRHRLQVLPGARLIGANDACLLVDAPDPEMDSIGLADLEGGRVIGLGYSDHSSNLGPDFHVVDGGFLHWSDRDPGQLGDCATVIASLGKEGITPIDAGHERATAVAHRDVAFLVERLVAAKTTAEASDWAAALKEAGSPAPRWASRERVADHWPVAWLVIAEQGPVAFVSPVYTALEKPIVAHADLAGILSTMAWQTEAIPRAELKSGEHALKQLGITFALFLSDDKAPSTFELGVALRTVARRACEKEPLSADEKSNLCTSYRAASREVDKHVLDELLDRADELLDCSGDCPRDACKKMFRAACGR
jgi:hypothetical protein